MVLSFLRENVVKPMSPYYDGIFGTPSNTTLMVLTLIAIILYRLYYRKYRNYIYEQKERVREAYKTSRPRGKCPPFFPNGWYRLLNSDELQKNQVKYINYCGRDVAVFRSEDGTVHALHAFCLHMGANLGIGGQVKGSCIECPFHGWTFDGKTGECVVSAKTKVPKQVQQFEYNNDLKEAKIVDGAYLKKCYEGNTKLKRYLVREQNNSIMIWYDSRDKYQEKPYFEPFDFDDTPLEYRGESINFVNCHIQEIPENGADIRHFDFLHTSVADCISFMKFEWSMLSNRASDPELHAKMKHRLEYVNDFKMKLLNKYITEENKPYVNVISLDCYLKIFKWRVFMFNATGFQVGPALVYLFLKSPFYELTFAQSITPLDKFEISVSHKIYTSWYLPYFLTAYMLYGEVRQVMNDMSIWNNKVFGSKLTYNMKADSGKLTRHYQLIFGAIFVSIAHL